MIGNMEILLIILAALILFGPDRLPKIARELGRAIREFRNSLEEDLAG